jgi:hypothetical protein
MTAWGGDASPDGESRSSSSSSRLHPARSTRWRRSVFLAFPNEAALRGAASPDTAVRATSVLWLLYALVVVGFRRRLLEDF